MPRHQTTPISATDSRVGPGGPGAVVFARLVRKVAHEARNRLNGLAVNLEVVRHRITDEESAGDEVASFVDLAASESEQVASVTEGLVALLQLTIAAVDENGEFRCSATDDNGIAVEVSSETIERLTPRLVNLGRASGFRVETRDSAVILTFPSAPAED